jgi:hypothetical protein
MIWDAPGAASSPDAQDSGRFPQIEPGASNKDIFRCGASYSATFA